MAAAGLAAVFGLALPATAAQAGTSAYTPPAAEWWTTSESVPQQVWPVTEGAGVTVAVIDSGVQATAPDLSGTVLSGADTLTPGGNGDRDYAPAPGHGTLVAEMIAGQGTGGGPVGLAPHARILPVRVDEPGPTSPAAVPAGIAYAVNHGASVINLSLGIPSQFPTWCDPAMQAAVSYALAHNVVVIASAGDTTVGGKTRIPVEPASCAGVLAVGGIEPTGQLWPNSSLEPYVSVAAPADRIPVRGVNGQPGTGSGTSFASPLVAATAALIRSKYPKMPWYAVDQRIIGTATTVPPAKDNDYGFGYGYGILNVAKAVNVPEYPVPASSPNPVYTRYAAWLNTMGGQAWAKANGVAVPSPGPVSSTTGGNGTNPLSPGSFLRWKLASIVIACVVVLVLAATVLALILGARRKRQRQGRLADVALPETPGFLAPADAVPTDTMPTGAVPADAAAVDAVPADAEDVTPEQAAQS